MKPSSRNLSGSNHFSDRRPLDCAWGRQATSNKHGRRGWPFHVACCVLLVAGLTGCESLQRKLTRKSKPKPPPTPIISFQDYTAAMTPLDRYRKHYTIFDYWNSELIAAFEARTPNPKRIKLASSEAIGELETMKGLVVDEVAARFEPLLRERAQIDRELQRSGFDGSRSEWVKHRLEAQTRQIHRDLYWRKVEDQLKSP